MDDKTCPNCGRPFDGLRHAGDPCDVCEAGTDGMADPGRATRNIGRRLEYLRGEINNERISYGEVAELEGLAAYIDPSDVQLREWASVPEHPIEIETEATEYVEIERWDGITGQWAEHWYTSTQCGEPEALLTEARATVEREMKQDPSQRFRVRAVKETIYSTEP